MFSPVGGAAAPLAAAIVLYCIGVLYMNTERKKNRDVYLFLSFIPILIFDTIYILKMNEPRFLYSRFPSCQTSTTCFELR